MHKFSEFASTVHFVGDKISINKILNKEINVLHYKIEPSKHNTDDYAQNANRAGRRENGMFHYLYGN